jgi:hypothetical protein
VSAEELEVDFDEIDRLKAEDLERAARRKLRVPAISDNVELEINFDDTAPIKERKPKTPSTRYGYASRQQFPDFKESIGGPIRPKPVLCEIEGCGDLAFALDHCHETGKFRGWLCHGCNTALGRFGDNIENIMRVMAYLRRFHYQEDQSLNLKEYFRDWDWATP